MEYSININIPIDKALVAEKMKECLAYFGRTDIPTEMRERLTAESIEGSQKILEAMAKRGADPSIIALQATNLLLNPDDQQAQHSFMKRHWQQWQTK